MIFIGCVHILCRLNASAANRARASFAKRLRTALTTIISSAAAKETNVSFCSPEKNSFTFACPKKSRRTFAVAMEVSSADPSGLIEVDEACSSDVRPGVCVGVPEHCLPRIN